MLDTDNVAISMPTAAKSGTILLVTAVRLRDGPNGLQLDDQTCAGIVRWTEHFERVVFAGIGLDAHQQDDTTTSWVDVETLFHASQVRFIALPMAYKIGVFARTYRSTRNMLAREIRQADHLCFTIGYLVGDWAAVAALDAKAQGRKYAVWFDRVEHEVLGRTIASLPLKRQIKERATLLAMRPYHLYLTRYSALALLQGMDTFNAYQKFSGNPACVYDVHTGPDDFAKPADIDAKLSSIRSGAPLRIVYAGRAVTMKGPFDWLDAIAGAVRAGVALEATWLGDGPLLPAMQARASELRITRHVTFAGHIADRERMLAALRAAHLFMFCHKTPESPRCLIEALVSACPIVGYHSDYAQGLLQPPGAGRLTSLHDVQQLSAELIELAANRPVLADLVQQAALAGRRFDEKTLYDERAQLIATYV